MLHHSSLPRLFALCLCLSIFLPSAYSQLFAQNINVTFRLADPQKRYIRAFVPGEFNNWGPNANGRISAGAVSEMSYDAASGAWLKTVNLRVGQRYLYKFHVHRDASGAQAEWFPDPLNDVQDGSANQNSVLQVSPLLVFQPSLQMSGNMVSGVQASIITTNDLTQLMIVSGRDTTFLTTALRAAQQSGFVRVRFANPVPTTATVRILANDIAGNTSAHRFPVLINATPAWARDAVWYQIFPERFRNGDPRNDPTRESLELGNGVTDKWRIKPWGSDWFSRDEWEREFGTNFYNNSIFHRRYGGDLQGIIDRLDYLRDLGITALYLNPIFYANSLHKYDGNAHHHIDPYFGPNPQADLAQIARENASAEPYNPRTWRWTSADSLFLRLIQETKRRNMRVILDGVWNHTGRGFFAFQDIVRNQAQSRFKDWYAVSRFDDPATAANEFTYKSWENFTSLPEFARTADGRDLAPAPKDYIWNVTRRWMDPNGDGNPDDGIDGWRLDVVPYMPLGFWNEWNIYVRSLNPNAYTTAEIWTDQTPAIVRGGNFSAAMNYWAFLQPVKDFFINKRGTAETFWNTITSRMNAYSPEVQAAMQNMMDSHDTERLASQIVNSNLAGGPTNNAWGRASYIIRKPTEQERDVQKLIALFQMTFTGAPMLYYGTESGIWGGNDPDDRSPMNWADIRFDAQAASHSPAFMRPVDDMNFDSSLVGFYKRAFLSRKEGLGINFFEWATNRTSIRTVRLPSPSGVLAFTRFEFVSDPDRFNPAGSRASTSFYSTTILNLNNDSISIPLRDTTRNIIIGNRIILFTHGRPPIIQAVDSPEYRLFITLPPRSGIILSSMITTTSKVQTNAIGSTHLTAYPQPFTERTTLEYRLERASEVLVRVHDALGREVMRFSEGMLSEGVHTRELDGAGLARGVYCCTVSTHEGAVWRVKLMKQ
ncbi:MAG: T9SS C-terminal target domain-containing protein [Candidatus Kapaibacterium sp.]|nr:MAG: T9SS C-terminal target domain-containing protein [Candidatus Kapabacteria bacterium]